MQPLILRIFSFIHLLLRFLRIGNQTRFFQKVISNVPLSLFCIAVLLKCQCTDPGYFAKSLFNTIVNPSDLQHFSITFSALAFFVLTRIMVFILVILKVEARPQWMQELQKVCPEPLLHPVTKEHFNHNLELLGSPPDPVRYRRNPNGLGFDAQATGFLQRYIAFGLRPRLKRIAGFLRPFFLICFFFRRRFSEPLEVPKELQFVYEKGSLQVTASYPA